MSPPDADEIEVTVFGPGFGEAILLHLGAHQWVTIDSCVDTNTGLCTPLEYLEQIGQDPKTCIRGIVVTHWHDDHVRGLARLVEAAPKAKFYCSSALVEREFTTFAAAFNKDSTLKLTGGLSEIYRTICHLAENDRDIGTCGKDSRMLNIAASVLPHGQSIEVSSLPLAIGNTSYSWRVLRVFGPLLVKLSFALRRTGLIMCLLQFMSLSDKLRFSSERTSKRQGTQI